MAEGGDGRVGFVLLPTPTAMDGAGSRNSTAKRREDSTGNVGDTLTDAVWKTVGAPEWASVSDETPRRLLPTPRAEEREQSNSQDDGVALSKAVRLFPTPQAADGDGGRQETGAMGRGGVRPSGHKATLPLPTAVSMREDISDSPFAAVTDDEQQLPLLPTPTANEANPGAGGELRAAIVHGEGRRNETGVDTLGRSNHGRRGEPLLPTPNASDGDKGGPNRRDGKGNPYLSGTEILFPTPTTQDANNTGGDSQRDRNTDPLNVVVTDLAEPQLLPTPRADGETTSKRARTPRGEGGFGSSPSLGDIAREEWADEPQLLPTPRVTAERNSRGSMVDNQQWSSVALAQAMEIAQGILPREFKSWDEVPGELGRDARARIAEGLLPTPTAADGDRTSAEYARGNPTLQGAAADVNWGVYESAVRRWEEIFGEHAPPPTDERGRLDPDFVRWMLGYPPGWFDIPGLKRTRKLRCLGNSVQVQCGELVGHWLRFLVESGLLT